MSSEMLMCFTIGLIMITIISFIILGLKQKKTKAVIEKLDFKKVVEINVFAKKFLNIFGSFIIALPFLLTIILIQLNTQKVKNIFIFLFLLSILTCMHFVIYYWTLEGTTKAIIEYKKMEKGTIGNKKNF